jgi:hypothetical protein
VGGGEELEPDAEGGLVVVGFEVELDEEGIVGLCDFDAGGRVAMLPVARWQFCTIRHSFLTHLQGGNNPPYKLLIQLSLIKQRLNKLRLLLNRLTLSIEFEEDVKSDLIDGGDFLED